MSDLSNAYMMMCDALPKQPDPMVPFWTTGGIILASTEEKANELADFFDENFGAVTVTGYYDPDEDEKNNMVDMCTGYWYIDI